MGTPVRLMPHHDPRWQDKVARIERRHAELLSHDGLLTLDEQRELMELRRAMDLALKSRFRTTLEYRDFYFALARQLLEDEGIDMCLPDLPTDATVEEIDRVLGQVWAAVDASTAEPCGLNDKNFLQF